VPSLIRVKVMKSVICYLFISHIISVPCLSQLPMFDADRVSIFREVGIVFSAYNVCRRCDAEIKSRSLNDVRKDDAILRRAVSMTTNLFLHHKNMLAFPNNRHNQQGGTRIPHTCD